MSDQTFLYFAYGSNMCRYRITAADRAPSARSVGVGYVRGYRLTFDKLSRDGSGKCDCEHTGNPQDRVYGVLYLISVHDKPALDRAEGRGNGYDEAQLAVTVEGGHVTATSYLATRKQAGVRPYRWYRQHVLNGAHDAGLPAPYIAAIAAVECIEDPDPLRAAREHLRPWHCRRPHPIRY